MRGDEPDTGEGDIKGTFVFPACAGMNRSGGGPARCGRCVPRMRGDEPLNFTLP